MKSFEFVADFETCTTEPTFVWLWAIADGEQVVHGGDIESFLYHLFNNTKYHNSKIFFHNLKFDGNFIVHALIKYGIEFDSSINIKGVWYRLEIPELGVVFLDSLKLLLTGLSNINDNFGFNYSKGTLDYSWIDYSIEAYMYIDNDVNLVFDALKLMRENGMVKNTTAANALNIFKQSINNYKILFPELKTEEVETLKFAYKGGYSYAHRPGIHDKVLVLDVNSMYPHVMRNYPMPVGFPQKHKIKDAFTIYQIGINAFLKDGSFPTIPLVHKTKLAKYESEVYDRKMWVTEVDLERIHKNYRVVQCEILDRKYFRTETGIFNSYIDKAMEEKINAPNLHMRFMAKIKLNSLYGKFAASPFFTKQIPIIEDEVLKYVQQEPEESKTVYIPVGIATTAYARDILHNAIDATIERFCYCDTDSIHITGWDVPTGLNISDTALGAWKLEGYFDRAKYIRPKTYVEEASGRLHVTCAGMPDSCHDDVTFDNFEIGRRYYGKKRATNVKGGIIITDTYFTLL